MRERSVSPVFEARSRCGGQEEAGRKGWRHKHAGTARSQRPSRCGAQDQALKCLAVGGANGDILRVPRGAQDRRTSSPFERV